MTHEGKRIPSPAPGVKIEGRGPYFAKIDSPELEASKKRASSLSSRFLASGTEVISELTAEVGSMHVAQRFNPERKMLANAHLRKRTQIEAANPDITEPEHKRAQLDMDLRGIQEEYKRLADRLAGVVLDIEATKTD